MLYLKQERIVWKNWSESVVAHPKTIFTPNDLEELILFVKQCAEKNMTIRVVGAGHSFTPLVATNEALVSLDNLSGVVEVNNKEKLATVWAGTRLRDVGPLLFEYGYAMENLGDTNAQSIAGATSTGTHGTGVNFRSISNQIEGLTLLTASGELIEINRNENNQYFDAARVALGMFGIIVKVTLRVVDAYMLQEKSYRLTLDKGLESLERLKKSNRNFEFFWFPYTNLIQVKTLNEVGTDVMPPERSHSFKKLAVENGLFWILSEMSRNIPSTSRLVSKVSALGIPTGEEQNRSYIQYITPRLVKFNEMEYCVPEEAMADVIRDIESYFNRKKIDVHFPLECRYVKGDSIWLSPSYKRDSAYIAVHMYKGMDFSEFFEEVEEIFFAYDGRPHWGKMHTVQFDQIEKLYPKVDDFLKLRKKLDPNGMFLNEYLRSMFAID